MQSELTLSAQRVLAGWFQLTPEDKTNVLEVISEYEYLRPAEAARFEERVLEKMALGSRGDTCPCCGR